MNAPLFFFTAEDPREIPKGSRDPLRFLPEWTSVARRMIPYLTTVTPSYRGFLTRFLFHGLLEDVSPALANASAGDQWAAFCKFEQLCAFIRVEAGDRSLPGISGVVADKRIKKGVLTVSAETPYWLVSSQKNTGYWGYYHQASLGSNLIKKNRASSPGYQLTDGALAVYRKSSAYSRIMQFKPVLESIFHEKVVKVDIAALSPISELFCERPLDVGGDWGAFWFGHLLEPNGEAGRCYARPVQSQFSTEVRKAWNEAPNALAGELWERLEKSSNEAVAEFARQVMAHEAVIGLCEWVFDTCRVRSEENLTLSSVSASVYSSGHWDEWIKRLGMLETPNSEALASFRAVILQSDNGFESLARVLLDRHKNVMADRDSLPWVELDNTDYLIIKELSSEPSKPKFEENPYGIRWRYDYFMNSWLRVAREVGYLVESHDG